MLDLAARLAWRGAGKVEPNPLVGCVIVSGESKDLTRGARTGGDRIIGMGHHRRFGGPHAEAEAIEDARRRGFGPLLAGSTVYVTLEPCNAAGRNPACVGALLEAKPARVVFARRDSTAGKGGGAETLRAAGIIAELSGASAAATAAGEAWAKRAATELPWVIAKWAQTIDGRVATRTGESQWISGERSRRWVHVLRGRVDAILTGIGTVKADDPRLTARGVPARRTALRVVVDPSMELSAQSAMVRGAMAGEGGKGGEGGRVIALTCVEARKRASHAAPAGVTELRMPLMEGAIDLRLALARLRREFGVSTVMAEGGPGLLGRLLAMGLIDEAQVYVGPMVMGDAEAKPVAGSLVTPRLMDATRWRLVDVRRVDEDVRMVYRRGRAEG